MIDDKEVSAPSYFMRNLRMMESLDMATTIVIDCNKEEVPSDADNDIREQIEEFHKRDITTDQSSRMGTTPRRYSDLLGSLADLTSSSGDKGTPIVWIKNYFKNWTDK